MESFSIQPLINEAVSERREKKEQNGWYASRLGSCPCGQWLERKGEEPTRKLDDRILRKFAVGSVFEEWVVSIIKKTENVVTQERIAIPELCVSGRIDLFLPDKQIIYEIKTVHSQSFWHMEREGKAAYPHHKMQLWVYLKAKGVETGRILMISKDDLSVREAPVFLSDKAIEKMVMDELTLLNTAWTAGLPPKPVTDPKDWRYKFCDYHDKCKEIYKSKQYLEANATLL